MKSHLLLLAVLIYSASIAQQVEDIITADRNPSDIVFHGNYIYYSLIVKDTARIYRTDKFNPGNNNTELIHSDWTATSSINFLLTIYDNKLFVGMRKNIYAFDLNNVFNPPIDTFGILATEIVISLDASSDGVFIYDSGDNLRKLKYPNTGYNSYPMNLRFSATDIQLNNDFLYLSENKNYQIERLNTKSPTLTRTTFMGALIKNDILAPICTSFDRSKVYVFFKEELYDNYIYSFDTSNVSSLSEGTLLYTFENSNGPNVMEVDNGFLYLVRKYDNKISRIQIGTSGISSYYFNDRYVVYPNPSKDYISFRDIAPNTEIKILNLAGQVLNSYTVNPDEKLNIQELAAGTYSIVIDNKYVSQIVKQK